MALEKRDFAQLEQYLNRPSGMLEKRFSDQMIEIKRHQQMLFEEYDNRLKPVIEVQMEHTKKFDALFEMVAMNTEAITMNTLAIDKNTINIEKNNVAIAANTAKIDMNTQGIAANTAKIDLNTQAIANSEKKIDMNTETLESVKVIISRNVDLADHDHLEKRVTHLEKKLLTSGA